MDGAHNTSLSLPLSITSDVLRAASRGSSTRYSVTARGIAGESTRRAATDRYRSTKTSRNGLESARTRSPWGFSNTGGIVSRTIQVEGDWVVKSIREFVPSTSGGRPKTRLTTTRTRISRDGARGRLSGPSSSTGRSGRSGTQYSGSKSISIAKAPMVPGGSPRVSTAPSPRSIHTTTPRSHETEEVRKRRIARTRFRRVVEMQGKPRPPITWQDSVPSFRGVRVAKNWEALADELFHCINNIRKYPGLWVKKVEQVASFIDSRKVLRLPGEAGSITHEGHAAWDEAVSFLSKQPALLPLEYSKALAEASRDLCEDQGIAGIMGHAGTDGSRVNDRTKRYGRWQGLIGEVIDYGLRDAEHALISMVVCDGAKTRTNRSNLFNPKFRIIGIAAGDHIASSQMVVCNLAGGFVPK